MSWSDEMNIKFLFICLLLFIVGCEKEEPPFVKIDSKEENTQKVNTTQPKKERTSIKLQFEDQQIKINLNSVPILKEYITTSKDPEKLIQQMRIIPLNTSVLHIYLLEFSCVNTSCSYLLLNEQQDKKTVLLTDMASFIQSISSADQQKTLLHFQREGDYDIQNSKVIAVDMKDGKFMKITPERTDFKLNYNWPLMDIEWGDDQTIHAKIPAVENIAELETWQDKGAQTEDLTLNIK